MGATLTPWTQYAHGSQIYGGTGFFITSVQSANANEDAKLIVRAVNSYDALVQALTGLLADISEYQEINNLGGSNNHWQVAARAALAKAKGD